MVLRAPRWRWAERWSTDPPVQAGVAAASWAIAGTFARSLLPRDPTQQAVASGVTAAIHYQLAATSWASMQALAAKPGERPGVRASLTVAGIGIGAGLGVSALTTPRMDESFTASIAAAVGRITAFSALAGGAASLWDDVLHRRLHLSPGPATTMLPSVATGAAVVAFSVWNRSRRATEYGIVAPERTAVVEHSTAATARALGVGAAAGLGFAALTTGEQIAAHSLEHGLSRLLHRPTGALGTLLAHGVILGSMTGLGALALGRVTQSLQRRDDIVEPAYPVPPTSPFVSAGPSSQMPFSSIGKEGRRFVLMALTASDIQSVMDEPAMDPVRIVGGFESASGVEERAALILQDMHTCGAFNRSLIAVGVPTGVGYFNYTVAEALEYLTRGDCATVVPQYALVPSALALTETTEAEHLTRMVLHGIQQRISDMPPADRPGVVLIGESLGANVALDVAINETGHPDMAVMDELGVTGGLYLGVPFRTQVWRAWHQDPDRVDPSQLLQWVSEPSEITDAPEGRRSHVMVIHHDDPVNKYGFKMVFQPPWWMGNPNMRPPLVPRESKFRPFTSFILATIDLFNGMNSKPGTFERRAHDYRIDAREGLQRAFGLTCSPDQAERIEAALRRREQQWATRRMVSRKLDKARRSIERQLQEWGISDIQGADLDPESAEQVGTLAKLARISGPPGS
jgi:uncharacterized membrane protein